MTDVKENPKFMEKKRQRDFITEYKEFFQVCISFSHFRVNLISERKYD